MSRSFIGIAVGLPLLALGLGIVRAELTFARTRDFTFEITGYDPRDLLRGHYLQFRLRVEPPAGSEGCTAADGCCWCLSAQSDQTVPRTEPVACSAARSCDAWLGADVVPSAFRFYVSDVQAPELERRLLAAITQRTAFAVMAVDGQGRAHVRRLLVDGKNITGKAAP